ncbi:MULTISPECIES: DegV family protein [unclassified Paenibacillus]|uniref:DegV family protein n=1 Tax=unclassified Paenibacillus TaxID=185978 RepID=UPI001C123ADC|nr:MULTISPECIES: DegV family protein [unclassified Paenibacillus]MBU5444243.1 DegV family protein [Paenibacillus sp. MSJ-34]CAH0120121.1 Protein DegV [Paenibacillus sp. CECT 9249]
MGKIRIVTDSTSDIPREVRERWGITMIPLKVHFGEEEYSDAVTIEPAQFYEKLQQASKLPTTSQPSPVDFVEVYERLGAEPGTEIISFHLSAALSGTYQSAVLAKSMLEDKIDVTIIDSKSASYGFGMLVVTAARLAAEGKSKEEILEAVETLRQRRKLYFLVDTLEYLQKGGRIGKASAMLGTILNIKPILSIDDEGEVHAVEKVRGHKKAVARIIELLKGNLGSMRVNITIGYATDRSEAEAMEAQLREHFDVAEVDYTLIGSVIGTHVGPGVIAVFMSPA